MVAGPKSISSVSPSLEKLLNREEVRSLLKNLDKHGIDIISPRLSETGEIVYLDELPGLNNSQLLEILEALVSENMVTKALVNPPFHCPNCNSKTATHSLICPNCHGTDLISGSAVQHLPCLNFDFESSFVRRGGSTICPKCDRELFDPGVDYLTPGTFFKCITCGEFTARALRLYTCDSCHEVFETTKESMIQVYEYRITKETKEIFARYLQEVEFSTLVGALKMCGLEVRASNILKGRSGVDHMFTVVANYPGIEDRSKLFVIDVISSPSRVGISPVISLFGKAVDCRIKHRVLVAVPELEFEAKIFARNYNISFIEADRHLSKEAVNRLQTILAKESVQHKDSAKLQDFAKLSQQTTSIRHKSAKKRSSLDIMVDILKVVNEASSKTEIMACANLSYDQCQKYIPALGKLDLLAESSEDGVHYQFAITEKGREFLSRVSSEFGRIADGDETVWNTRRRTQSNGNNMAGRV